jgi:hypothetical protein
MAGMEGNAHLKDGNQKCQGFPTAGDGLDHDILVSAKDLETGLLHWRRMREAH